MSKRKEWICLTAGFLGAMSGLYGVVSFNRFVLMSLPLAARMAIMPAVYWLIALVPAIIMIARKENAADCGFSRERIGTQILAGVLIGAAMSIVLTLLPHLLGLGAYFDSGKRYQHLWQFVYEFFYCISAVGFVEEFVFRGFVYAGIRRIFGNDTAAVLGSSVLFGLFHLFSGNILQMMMTALLGALFCLCKLKIKNCSTLSLAIGHGIYDALITVWSAVLP